LFASILLACLLKMFVVLN
jgi:hypothetical protein